MKQILNNWMKQQSRKENAVYLALWGTLFAAPVLSMLVRSNGGGASFDWSEVLMVWRQYCIFLAVFLLHNFILAPLLVYQQKRTFYFTSIAVITGLFLFYQCSSRPDDRNRGPHHEMAGTPPPKPIDDWGEAPPEERGEHHPPKAFKGHRPPPVVGEHEVISVIVLILMLGMNLGIKLYFKSRHDQKQLDELEKRSLEQQLEHLKYQINPHFFMNTLNNIHALVDIDPEKAKTTILEMSKLMRYVLYEGDKPAVPLNRELDFIRNYIRLMRLRYTEKVRIDVDLPEAVPDRKVPPLLLISFIENAFKHGVSYQKESFITVKITCGQSTLHFDCNNSKQDNNETTQGGVGLTNSKQRLNLIYGNNFTLNIDDEQDSYNVELTIPLL